MRGRVAVALCLLALVPACGVAPPQTRDRGACPALFRDYDRVRHFNPGPSFDPFTGVARYDPWLTRLKVMLVQNDCITRARDVADLDALAAAAAPIVESGAPLGRRVAVHVGTFAGDAEAARAVALFQSVGLRATSVGDQLLGRRVFAGPVTTEGGLGATVELARRAGFVAPYPSEFFRF